MSLTSRPVRLLPDAVADQIAAGEVVERPASVVKELVENALDAGASHVVVRSVSGGKTMIEVSDDGFGMGREDAVLALDRHATSKIAVAADLVGVTTFGFRGEAIPAIASVSRFQVVTAPADGVATAIRVAGGRVEEVGEGVRQRGTTVTVQNLFFNTPARRKFLRSVGSESRVILDVVSTLALAHPTVGFRLEEDDRVRLDLPAGQSLEVRLEGVWGRDLVGTLVPVAYAVGGFRVEGFIQRPSNAQPTGRRVQLFINGRPFRDSFLVRAAEAGYRSAIHPGDRPSMLLRVACREDDVDVNVHPAKLEVRFRDRIGLERVVEEAVRDALRGLASAAVVGGDGGERGTTWLAGDHGNGDEERHTAPLAHDLFGELAPVAVVAPEGGDPGPRSFAAPLWQAFDTYVVFEGAEGLVFVDQHSAHERVLFQRVMADLTGPHAAAQRLLLPLTIALTDEELDVIEHFGEALAAVGFTVEPFGGRNVILHAVPMPHPRFDAAACFREVVADLARGRFGGWNNRLERFAATFACRAAVKAGQTLGESEMRALLLELFATPLPAHDVHGRATILQLPRDELERRFGRR